MKFLDYIRGLRTGKNARLIEHEAMNDPFLADAIDGYDSVNGNHADNIARMQTRISARTVSHKNRSGAWKIAIAAVVFIAFLGGYFALMNHESTMLVAHEQDNSYINIYAPEAYIEQKSLELTEMRETGESDNAKMTAMVDISNLNEVIKPVDRIEIYIPEAYAQLKKEDIEELSSTRERQNVQHNTRPLSADNVSDAVMSTERVLISEILDATLPPASPSASIMGDEMKSKNKDLAFVQAKPVPQQLLSGKLLKGKVVDELDEPLPGVTVMQKGTNRGVVTDMEGQYEIQLNSSEKANIIINYLGYETIEIPDPKDNQIIAMKEDNQQLSEVVVMGYSTQKRSSLTGSVATVSSKDRKKKSKNIPLSEPVAQQLQGRVAGVNVSDNQSGSNIHIRGNSTAKESSITDSVSKIGSDKPSIQTKPKPLVGDKEYKKYLKENINRPSSACDNVKGKVVLEFGVDTSGRPVDIKVHKGLCEALDKEAIRLIEDGPDWVYGTSRTKVEVNF